MTRKRRRSTDERRLRAWSARVIGRAEVVMRKLTERSAVVRRACRPAAPAKVVHRAAHETIHGLVVHVGLGLIFWGQAIWANL